MKKLIAILTLAVLSAQAGYCGGAAMKQLGAATGGDSKISRAPAVIAQTVEDSGGETKSQDPSRARLRQFMCSGTEGSRFMASGELDPSKYIIRNAAYSTYSPGASVGLFHLMPDYSYRPSGDNIGTIRFFFQKDRDLKNIEPINYKARIYFTKNP